MTRAIAGVILSGLELPPRLSIGAPIGRTRTPRAMGSTLASLESGVQLVDDECAPVAPHRL
jgi:hypothetical protein